MKIEFSEGNLAPEYDNDPYIVREYVCHILEGIKEKVENGEDHGPVMDVNGNKIGSWSMDN